LIKNILDVQTLETNLSDFSEGDLRFFWNLEIAREELVLGGVFMNVWGRP